MTNLLTKIFGKKIPTAAHALAFDPEQEHKDLLETHSEFFEPAFSPEYQMQSKVNVVESVKIIDTTKSRSIIDNEMQAPTISSSGEILEGLELNEEYPDFVEETEEITELDTLRGFEVFNSAKEMNEFFEQDPDEQEWEEEIMRSVAKSRSKPSHRDMLHSEGLI